MPATIFVNTNTGKKAAYQLCPWNPGKDIYLYSLGQFFDFNEYREITPEDGIIEGVIVDGCLVNVIVANWQNVYSWADNFVEMGLRDLENFYPNDVRIAWRCV